MDLNDLVYSNHGKRDPQINFNEDDLDQINVVEHALSAIRNEKNVIKYSIFSICY